MHSGFFKKTTTFILVPSTIHPPATDRGSIAVGEGV
uniref:Uncharacterized protein n=1 Tax=Anguilla anguilla TaxID=7936 RepID=A0A0E9T806_ANGAN